MLHDDWPEFDNYVNRQHDEFDKNIKKATRWAGIGFVVTLLVSLSLLCLTAWAVITLVLAVTK